MERDERGESGFERYCELRQQACHLRVEVAEIKKQLEENQKAMELASGILEVRLAGMNEVREQLNRQAADTIRREEVMLMLEKNTETFSLQLASLREVVESVRERESKIILMLGLALLALCGNVALQLILHLASRH